MKKRAARRTWARAPPPCPFLLPFPPQPSPEFHPKGGKLSLLFCLCTAGLQPGEEFPMKHLALLADACHAGHCTTGGSNKVWAACLAVERDQEQTAPLSTLSDATQVVYLCVY